MPNPKTPEAEPTCACGHPRSDHSRDRGVCFECYEASDHGEHTYCQRYRRPKGRRDA